MPATEVIFYMELDGSVPVLDWFEEVGHRDRRAVEKCAARIDMLRQQGHDLRRPIADYLRDGIHELRTNAGRVQYRILYFFHGKNAVVLAHGLVKEKQVPNADIERAISRRLEFDRAPSQHTFREQSTNG
jgi:phage-related protein